jgi:hypothetical protein
MFDNIFILKDIFIFKFYQVIKNKHCYSFIILFGSLI